MMGLVGWLACTVNCGIHPCERRFGTKEVLRGTEEKWEGGRRGGKEGQSGGIVLFLLQPVGPRRPYWLVPHHVRQVF